MENNYNIILKDNEKVKAIKIYREITGLGLKDSKQVIDNSSGIIFKNLSLSEANKIASKFNNENCHVMVCINSQDSFIETYSSDKTESSERVDVTTLSSKDLIVVLKRIKNTILTAEQLQNEMEAADKAVDNVKSKRLSLECGSCLITIIGTIIFGIFGLIGFSVIGLIIGLIIGYFIFSRIDDKINGSKNLKRAQQYYDKNYPIAEKSRNDTKAMAKSFFNSHSFTEAQEIIPSDYFDIESVEYIEKMIENRRADTLKEAINLYEDYLYKYRMEEMQKQQVIASKESAEAQKQTAEAMQENLAASLKTAKYAKSTARATKLNTFINIIKK